MYVRAVHTVKEIRNSLESSRTTGQIVGLVPTLGALHAGHIRLLQAAREECGVVVASIFLNPLQFGPKEDLERYPKTLPQDLEICRQNHVDFVFAPPVEEMYPSPQLTFVDVQRVSEHLCGAYRPGHFRGVATVVLKLFNIVQPHRAYFGEKDAQQLAVIRTMTRDLNLPITIAAVPTVREDDGLALSSRNRYLSREERQAAPVLYRALQEAGKQVRAGEKDPARIRSLVLELLQEVPLIRVEYVEIVDPDQMRPVDVVVSPVCIAAAVWIGSTRLIDNVLL